MLELRIKASPRRYVAPEGLRRAFGARRAREELGVMIEALMLQLDIIDGDADFENDTSDFEPSGDEHGDPAWCEWHTLSASRRKAGQLNGKAINPMGGMILEDIEDGDPAEDSDDDTCRAGDDRGTDHIATRKIGWDGNLYCEDAEYSGDENDTNNAEDECLTGETRLRVMKSGPGCLIGDSDHCPEYNS